MVSHLSGAGVRAPRRFATTSDACRRFLTESGLAERIRAPVEALDPDDVAELARTGAAVRRWIEDQPFPAESSVETEGLELALGRIEPERTASFRLLTSREAPDAHDQIMSIRGRNVARSYVARPFGRGLNWCCSESKLGDSLSELEIHLRDCWIVHPVDDSLPLTRFVEGRIRQ
jgi:hypothetical protein